MKNSLGVLALASVLTVGLLTGCGSSGSSAPAGPDGKVIQGPVQGAKVYAVELDANGDFDLVNLGTNTATTTATGAYHLPTALEGGKKYVLVSEDGKDTYTDEDAIQMLAPRRAGASGNITPITTLVASAASSADADAIVARIAELGPSAKYDDDISAGTSSAILMLAKSVENIQRALVDAVKEKYGSAAQQKVVQAQLNRAIASQVATKTAVELSTPAVLNTAIGAAATASAGAMATAGVTVTIPPSAIQKAVEAAVKVATKDAAADVNTPAVSTSDAVIEKDNVQDVAVKAAVVIVKADTKSEIENATTVEEKEELETKVPAQTDEEEEDEITGAHTTQ